MQIAKNTAVTFHYTLTDDEGNTIDSSRGRDPLVYIHGVGGIIPGLEQQMAGKQAGDEFKVRIPPEEAYGERDESMVQSVPRAQLPPDIDLQAGMQLRAEGGGEVRIITVVGVEGDQVTLDANHPLAGVALNFDVAVVGVREATPEELQHGHAHGPGGHTHD